MKKGKLGIIIFAIVIIIGQLTVIDYTELTWARNAGSFLGITSMILLIIAMISSNICEKNKK